MVCSPTAGPLLNLTFLQGLQEMDRQVERLRKELQGNPNDFMATYNLAAGEW